MSFLERLNTNTKRAANDGRPLYWVAERKRNLASFFVLGVLIAPTTIFLDLHPVWMSSLVFSCVIVSLLAILASKSDHFTHGLCASYSMISEITPAPTVRPPSRTANRSSCSIAMGSINSPSSTMLSPGITISVPSGNVIEPVTSVVRK
jgi:hypothetical protein